MSILRVEVGGRMSKEHAYAYESGYKDGYAARDGEIVRCKDCRYYDEIIHACERFDGIKQDNVSYVFDDGFCAWGERRES